MKVFVDKKACIGCGLCCSLCDTVFRMDEDDKAIAYQRPTTENMDATQSAIDNCPVAAISWED